MTILVTGGAGYIGSVTVERLIARGHTVVILDSLVTGHRAAAHPEASFVEGDIGDSAKVKALLEAHGVDAVMHFSASSLVGESMEAPLTYFHNNTAKTLALLTAMLEAGVKRFILSSTAALFGTPEKLPIPDDAPVKPESVYGESKHLIERMLHWLSRTAGLGYVTLRYFNAAGASERFGEDHDPETHLIPLTLQVALEKRESIGIFGDDYPTPDGTAIRDYIHVVDLADAHILALEAMREGEEHAYNLGNGQGFSVKEVIDVCRQVTGHPIPSKVLPRRAGDPPALVADSTRIKRELGWQPQYPDLEKIVASAWKWHRAHPDGYGTR
jgi:UDP-glucose 4-epimerase